MPANLSEVDAIFCEAIEIASPEERSAYVAQACGDDAELRRYVEDLLVAHSSAGSFLEGPPATILMNGGPTIHERPGALIGPYKLLQQIGEGGMGVVFMAEQSEPIQRTVALKIIKPGMDTRQVITRFEAERQALAMMDHPNIAKVFDAGATNTGRPYFVMELVKGVPITRYCDDNRLSVRERLRLLVPVCQAVQHAHQKGIIHRDIKPTNILVAEFDNRAIPKVIDFGVAKATAQRLAERTMFTEYGLLIGTFEYMSPEQAKFTQLDIDTRSDIYSLGVLLYELLTGSTPFERQRLETVAFDETLRIIREEEPPAPSIRLKSSVALPAIAVQRQVEPAQLGQLVRGELDWIVMKALEKDRSHRYQTARDFARDLQRYLSDEPVQACPPTARYRFRKYARRNKAALATVAIVAISLMLGTFVSIWQAAQARRAEALAESRLKNETEARQQASEISAILQQMLQSAGPYHAHSGDYSVRQMLDDFSARLGDQLKDQPATRAAIHAIIGQTYLELGSADKAESHLKEGLALRHQTLGREHELVAQSLVDYAWYLRKVGKTDEAEKAAREALLIRQKLGNCDPSLMVSNLHLLQNIAANRRRFDEAEAFAQQALTIARAQPKPLPGESSILRTSADTALLQGDLVKAERLAREALASCQEQKGDDDLAAAAGWNALGNVLYRQLKFDQAEECYRQSIAIFVQRIGYCPIEVLDTLSVILYAKNDLAALKELRPLADAEEEKNGTNGWRTAVARGSLRARMSEWEKAEPHFVKVFELAPASVTETCAMADYYVALLRLRANDHSGYRAACIAARDHQSAKQKPAYFYVICAGIAAADSGVDPGQLVKLAEDGLAQHADAPAWLTVYGAALYRASRWHDAQTTLTKAIEAYDSLRESSRQANAHVPALLLQAIVTYRLNHKDEAQRWYEAALTKLESDGSRSQRDYVGMSWDSRLIAQLLRQEAQQLLVNHAGNASHPTDQVVDRSSEQPPTGDNAHKVQE